MQTYSPGETIFGKGAQVRYAIIPAGTATTRPVAAAFKLLKAVTTSEIKGTQDTKDTPVDYDSVDGDWKDARPGTRGWSFSMAVNVKNDSTQATDLQALHDAWASGLYVWIERLISADTFWRGGLGFITDPSDPAPADGVVTFSCGITGKGPVVKTAVV